MIYFIQQGDLGPIKIGFTANGLASRIASLQTASPYELRLLGTVGGDQKAEAVIHLQFSHLRLRGEWFQPRQELIVFIHKKCQEREPTEEDKTAWGLKEQTAHFESLLIKEALRICKNNKSLAANMLGISRPTLHTKLAEYKMGCQDSLHPAKKADTPQFYRKRL